MAMTLCPAMTLHRVSTKAMLDALPPRWSYWKHGKRRPMGDVILDLLRARGGYVSNAELVEYFYGGEEDGGPDWAENLIHVKVHRMRRKGHAIHTRWGYGYTLEHD